MMKSLLSVTVALVLGVASAAMSYPLDGQPYTHINRLEAYSLAQEPLLKRGTLKPGSLKKMEEVKLRLSGSNFTLPASDPELVESIKALLGEDVARYGVVVLDLSDPANPRYADINGGNIQNPASVGKIAVALAFFQALADVYPDDVPAREKLLFETMITANRWSQTDHHKVPIWKPGDPTVEWRPIAEGDTENLWTYFDWMASASSNGAASQLMSELMLLRKFGKEYPVSPERARAYFDDTPKATLSKEYLSAMLDPLKRNGLNPDKLRQGSFFTRAGKGRISGTNSVANARELVHFMTLMEEGKLVDPWSSLEIKRLLYLTDTRIRYAASPALDQSAVYFKSGSLYSCKEEAGFTCGKYIGNKWNYMNSIAIVEVEEDGRSLHYLVAVLSNVLKKNSANKHADFAGALHRLIESDHPPVIASPAESN